MSTAKSLNSKSPKRLASPTAPAPSLRTAFSAGQLLRRFLKLLSPQLVADWLAATQPSFYQRAFTPLITLWYFLFQRLHADHTLAGALDDAGEGGADALSPTGKPLSAQLRSQATASLSDARQRLPQTVLHQALCHTGQQIRSWAQDPRWHGRQVMLLDGTTVRLRPAGDLAATFPPHRTTSRQPAYWCLMRVVAGFCPATGVALDCAMGPCRLSEQVLAARLLARSWTDTLLVGDRNFGVYSVVRASQAARADVLLRLTKVRAAKLARAAGVALEAGVDIPVTWTPSRHDQCPEGLAPEPVAGRLLVCQVRRAGSPPITLYLFTTLTAVDAYPAAELVQLYGQRWQVELDLRYVKTQMDLAALACRSAAMARKEWLGGLLAYNLVRSLMVAAAARAAIPVLDLSFSRTRQKLVAWLARHPGRCRRRLQSWEILLEKVAQCRHPHRRATRPPEPRMKRYFAQDFPKLTGDRAAARRKLQNTKS
jgi:hypothetical protein